MKPFKSLTALLASGLLALAGCRGQEPPKTLAECQERRSQEIRSVLSGLRNVAPDGTDDAHWFEEGVNRLRRNDLSGYAGVLRVCSRSVRQALGPLEGRIESINLKYDKYEAVLSGKPWPPAPPAPMPQPEPQPPAPADPKGPMGGMMEVDRAPPKGESAELRLARAQLATAESKVRLEAARGGPPEVQGAAAQEVARLSELVAELSRRELAELEAEINPAGSNARSAIRTAEVLCRNARAEREPHPDKARELTAKARKILDALGPSMPTDEATKLVMAEVAMAEAGLFPTNELLGMAQRYKDADGPRAGIYVKEIMHRAFDTDSDRSLVRQILPLYKEIFADENTEEFEAFADGRPSPKAEAEQREQEAAALRKRQQKALQYYRNAVSLKTPNPKAARDYIRQALELEPEDDLRRKIDKLRDELERPTNNK